MTAKHTPFTKEKAAAASAKFLRSMSKDPVVRAADDMLEALREAERTFRNCPGNWPTQTHDLIRTAIAKAEGRTP